MTTQIPVHPAVTRAAATIAVSAVAITLGFALGISFLLIPLGDIAAAWGAAVSSPLARAFAFLGDATLGLAHGIAGSAGLT